MQWCVKPRTIITERGRISALGSVAVATSPALCRRQCCQFEYGDGPVMTCLTRGGAGIGICSLARRFHDPSSVAATVDGLHITGLLCGRRDLAKRDGGFVWWAATPDNTNSAAVGAVLVFIRR